MTKRILTLIFATIFSSSMIAQEAAPSTFTLAMNQDNAFGFAPAVYGSFGLKPNLSLTYYGIFWTNPAFSNGGIDNWLETGIGLSFTALDGKALINPSLGFTHGNLLTGVTGTPTGQVAEGIVPNLVVFYTGDYTELEFYAGYYSAIKDGINPSDFLLYWIYPGLRLTENISAGLHYEQFYLTNDAAGNAESFYQWMGGYLKFTVDKYSLRFSTGNNLNSDNGYYSNGFYKLSMVAFLL